MMSRVGQVLLPSLLGAPQARACLGRGLATNIRPGPGRGGQAFGAGTGTWAVRVGPDEGLLARTPDEGGPAAGGLRDPGQAVRPGGAVGGRAGRLVRVAWAAPPHREVCGRARLTAFAPPECGMLDRCPAAEGSVRTCRPTPSPV